MTAFELIQHLNDLPPEVIIVVRGYENGYNDIIRLKNKTIMINKEAEWYDGEYMDCDETYAISAMELFGENRVSER